MQFRKKITKMLSERKTQFISMQPKTEILFPQPEPATYTTASRNCGSRRFNDWDPAPSKVWDHVIPQQETEWKCSHKSSMSAILILPTKIRVQ